MFDFPATNIKVVREHRMLICDDAQHQHAILPRALEKHLKQHKDISQDDRRRTIEAVERLELKLKETQDEFIHPPEPIPIIPGLELRRGCSKCEHCGKILDSGASTNIRQHLSTHGIHVHPGKGRPSRLNAERGRNIHAANVRTVMAQRFFKNAGGSNRSGASWFEVYDPTTVIDPSLPNSEATCSSEPDEGSGITSSIDFDDDYPNMDARREQELEKDRTTIPGTRSRQTCEWIEEAKLQEILVVDGVPMRNEEVMNLVDTPNYNEEPKAWVIWNAVKTMVRVYQHTVEQAPRWVRIMVMREDDKTPPQKPLSPYDGYDVKHANGLQKVFAFSQRASNRSHIPDKWNLKSHQTEAWAEIEMYLSECDHAAVVREMNDEHRDPIAFHHLEKLCHNYWMALLQDTPAWNEIEGLPFVTPLAALAVGKTSFIKAHTYATELSSFKKMARFAFVQHLHDKFAPSAHAVPGGGGVSNELHADGEESPIISPVELENIQAARSHEAIDETRKLAAKYLSTDSPSPMEWVIRTAKYLSKFKYSDTLHGFVNWQGQTLQCRNVNLHMDDFRTLVHGIYTETRKKLLDLMFAEDWGEIPSIPWEEMKDQPSNAENQFSIFSASHNPSLSHGNNFVAEQVKKKSKRKSSLPTAQKKMLGWRSWNSIAEYGDAVETFKKSLMALIHLTYGQPARGTELLSIHHMNTADNEFRNIFLLDGLVAIVPQYHKGYHQNHQPQLVYRFLPREVGSLLAWYLWLVLPYYQSTQLKLSETPNKQHRKEQAYSPLLWSDSMGRQHSEASALSSILRAMSEKLIGQRISISNFRHIIIAIGRWLVGEHSFQDAIDLEDITMRMSEAEADAVEEKAGHTARTGRSAYALSMSQLLGISFKPIEAQRRESLRYHDLQGWKRIPSSIEHPMGKEAGCLSPSEPPSAAYATVAPIVNSATDPSPKRRRVIPNAIETLRAMYGPEACFRGKQEKVLQFIADGESPVVYVSATGSGKSIAFLLPAKQECNAVFVVIVPLIALRLGLMQECKKLGISCEEWDSAKRNRMNTARIVLAMPDQISQPSFLEWINFQKSTRRLRRIYVDEFHYLLLPHVNYRPGLRRLIDVAGLGVRMALLTATLPPSREKNAWRAFGIDKVALRIEREPTRRPNIQYRVRKLPGINRKYDSSDLDRYITRQVREAQRKHAPNGKTVVFVPSRGMAESIASKLGGWAFHGEMTEEKKREVLREFGHAEHGIIVATSALSHGFHDPNIRLVIHVGEPDGLIQYSQEAGRAGRDREPAVALILIIPNVKTHLRKQPLEEQHMVDQYLQLEEDEARMVCRRTILDGYLDGDQMHPCCAIDEQTCDACERVWEESKGPSRTSAERSSRGAMEPLEPDWDMVEVAEAARSPNHDWEMIGAVESDDFDIGVFRDDELLEAEAQTASSEQNLNSCRDDASIQSDPLEHLVESGTNRDVARGLIGSSQVARALPFSPKKKCRHVEGNGSLVRVPATSSQAQRPTPFATSSSRPSSQIVPVTVPEERLNPRRSDERRRLQEESLGNLEREARGRFRNGGRLCHAIIPQFLDYWSKYCPVCYAREEDHTHPRCPVFVNQKVGDMKGMLKKFPSGYCWGCMLPFDFCDKNQPGAPIPHEQSGRPAQFKKCRYPHLVVDLWALVWAERGMHRDRLVNRAKGAPEPVDLTEDNAWRAYYVSVEQVGNYLIGNMLMDLIFLSKDLLEAEYGTTA